MITSFESNNCIIGYFEWKSPNQKSKYLLGFGGKIHEESMQLKEGKIHNLMLQKSKQISEM